MKEALLLIDIQNDYFPAGRMELAGMEDAAKKVSALLELFRNAGKPIFFIRHLSTKSGAAFFIPGTSGADIHVSVQPLQGETVIEKHFPNSFFPDRTSLTAERGRCDISGSLWGNEPYVYRYYRQGCKGTWLHIYPNCRCLCHSRPQIKRRNPACICCSFCFHGCTGRYVCKCYDHKRVHFLKTPFSGFLTETHYNKLFTF